MDTEEVSAFAAYSSCKKPQKSDKKKKKLKQKFKKKQHENSVNSIMNTLVEATQNSESNAKKDELKIQHSKKKKLIDSILSAQKESIFKDCCVTTKIDNVFLKQNNLANGGDIVEENSNNKKVKKSKKKKNRKFEELNLEKSFENEPETTDNTFFIKTKSNLNGLEKPLKETNLIQKTNETKSKSKMPSLIYSDFVKVGEEVFSWLLSPLSLKDFFENCWEQKPVYISHKNENYFKSICSFEDLKAALRNNDMYFTKNIDITSYIDGERHTENPEGQAKPSLVWDFYKNGRSIRLLNPQTYIKNVRLLNSSLQEFFHCFVGANIYLTPPGTQGFAPHYDDIEAFVLQLEGEKYWRLYNPRTPAEVLPRESSRNFSEDEIGEPILEVTLKPGDLLYFPRGIIHQAKCLPHVHSLHITVSCYQKNSWADLFEKVLPVALQKTIFEDVELRKGLPIGYLNSFGMIYSDQESEFRREFIKTFERLAQKVLDNCPLDAGVDQMGADFIHDALPPCLSKEEKLHGASRDCEEKDKNTLLVLQSSLDRNLKVKLVRPTSVRLVSEEEEMILYYTTDNSYVYHEHEVFSVSISTQWAQGLEYLIQSYPDFVEMKEIPVSNKFNKPGKWKRIVEFIYFLWQKGLLLFDQPLLRS